MSDKATCDMAVPMPGERAGVPCPDDMEWRSLSEVAHYAKGRIPASDMGKAGYVGVETLLKDMRGQIGRAHV